MSALSDVKIFGFPDHRGAARVLFTEYLYGHYRGGVYSAGACCKMADILHGYQSEAMCCFDFPMDFEWDKMAHAAASVIEKMSDFGSTVRSSKCDGRVCKILCHCVVFSNREPLEFYIGT